ncbi:MAG: response regulator [Elusimicrobiota bacterium]|nr:response regulator [Elusimicrobiota bacterium]
MKMPEVLPAAACVDILHVEDDDHYADIVRRWMTPRGLTVARVRSRAELYGYLSAAPRLPRCLLIDPGLGDSHGLGLCDALKKAPSLQQLPIVLFSGSDLTACECLEHGVLHLIRKGAGDLPQLFAALTSVINQHSRSQGVVDIGDMHLVPSDLEVHLNGRIIAKLTPGPFAALLLLVKSAPNAVSDATLYTAFLERRRYHDRGDSALTIRVNLKEYVYRLRHDLGPAGARIERIRGEGYAYHPPV